MLDARVGRWGVLILVCSAAGCDCQGSLGDDDDDSITDSDAAAGHDADVPDAAAPDAGALEPPVTQEPFQLADVDIHFNATPHTAMDGEANGTVVFVDGQDIVARRWQARAWADLESLGVGREPRVDFNASGEGVVAWSDGDVFTATRWAPGNGWLGTDDLGDGRGAVGAIAIDGGGNIVVLFGWETFAGFPVRSARFEPATGWMEDELVEPIGVNTEMPDVEANEAGDFVGVWTHVNDRRVEPTVWWSRERDGWQEAARVVADQSFASWPRVAVDEAGNALLLWLGVGEQGEGLYAAWQIPGESPGDAEYLGPSGPNYASDVVAMGERGGFVAWMDDTDLLVARCDPGGRWQATETIDVLDGEVGSANVAADAEGNAVVTWQQDRRVWGARFLADDGWLDPVGINDPDDDGSTPSLALAPDGTALVAWLADDDQYDEVLQVWARILAADFWEL